MNKKQSIRSKFRNDVLTRDKFCCRCCGKRGYDRQGTPELNKVPLDAHHIIERTNDNYVIQNGISVCDECHLKAEQFHITNGKKWIDNFHPNDLFKLINSNWKI
jgi:5-methylcytosine-specific restriction endonuclease McrA